MLTEDELNINIKDIIDINSFNSIKDMGKVMSILKEQFDGLYDGKIARIEAYILSPRLKSWDG